MLFHFSGLPTKAVITKVLVDASMGMTTGGKGAIVSNKVLIKSPSNSEYVSTPWKSQNKTEVTTGLLGKLASGTWSVYYNGSM